MSLDVSVIAEVVTFVGGCAGIAISHWRGQVRIANQVENLSDQVEKQNGRLGKLEDSHHQLEITCAANHGKTTFRLVPMDGDEP